MGAALGAEVGVVGALGGYGGTRAVAGIDNNVGGEGQELGGNALDEQGTIAAHDASEIRSADAAIEKHVTAEEELVVDEMIAEAVMAVAGTIEYLYPTLSELQDVAFFDILRDGEPMEFIAEAKDIGLNLRGGHVVLILHAAEDLDMIGLGREGAAHAMIDVVVSQEHRLEHEVFGLNTIGHALPFRLIGKTRIDDKSLAGNVVPDEIAIHLQGVAGEGLDAEHNKKGKRRREKGKIRRDYFLNMGVNRTFLVSKNSSRKNSEIGTTSVPWH